MGSTTRNWNCSLGYIYTPYVDGACMNPWNWITNHPETATYIAIISLLLFWFGVFAILSMNKSPEATQLKGAPRVKVKFHINVKPALKTIRKSYRQAGKVERRLKKKGNK